MQRHDSRRNDPTRVEKTEATRVPGKRTLVEGVGHRAPGEAALDPAAEAAKGATDINPKQSVGGGADHTDAGITDAHAALGAAGKAAGATAGGAAPKAEAATAGGAAPKAEAAPAEAGLVAPATADSERQPKAELGASAMFGAAGRAAAVETSTTSASAVMSSREAKQQAVKPTASPTFNGAAGSNDCLPGDATGASIAWTVVAGATTWGVSVSSFTTTGTINVAPWPSKPTEMTTRTPRTRSTAATSRTSPEATTTGSSRSRR
jgi:hypothetical protein